MFERKLKTLIESQLALIAAEPSRMRLFLESHCNISDTSELDLLVETFTTEPIKVYHDLAQTTVKFPNYAIILKDEYETESQLNDFAGPLPEEDATTFGYPEVSGAVYYGSIFSRKFEIFVHAVHPDVCIVAYEFLKMMIMLAKNSMLTYGFSVTKVSGQGIDMVEAPEKPGDFIFRRVLTIEGVEMFSAIDASNIFGDFTNIDGMHVQGGSPNPVEGVEALTTVYVPE